MVSEVINGVEYRVYSAEEWAPVMIQLLTSGWRPHDVTDGRLAGSRIVKEFERLRSRAVVVAK